MKSHSINSFSQFSYYEVNTGEKYVSMFPSVNTTPCSENQIGSNIFNNMAFTEEHLKIYLKFLVSMNLGFKDQLGWLLPPDIHSRTIFNALELCQHLKELKIISTENDQYATLATVISPIFNTSFVLRLHQQSSPQKAIDTIPCYINGTEVITTVGYKKKSSEVTIVFSDNDNMSVLNIGIFGYVNGAGEHVNARQEGIQVNNCIAEFRETINDENKVALYKDVEIANRGLIEEVGLDVQKNEHVKFFIFGISDNCGRDIRYSQHQYFTESGKMYEFGYQRLSESILVASIIKAIPPTFLPDPSDLEEMEVGKTRLIKLDDLLAEFKVDRKLKPAFSEHSNQLATLSRKLHLML